MHTPDLAEVTAVRVVEGTVLELTFKDGYITVADVKPLMIGPVFDEIFILDIFDTVFVDVEGGTIAWANGADIAPEILREL